ncbi:transposase [Streptomyces sp. NPDC048392]|uniref:transposase n=1 Tax=Streptomyces sp. NPDC048392 TaxID=3365543 RepID=UPI00371F711F
MRPTRQDWDKIAKTLKPVCTATNEAAATARFSEFQEVRGKEYPAVIRLWENAWAEFVPFLSFDVEIDKSSARRTPSSPSTPRISKAVRARGHFPNETSALVPPCTAARCSPAAPGTARSSLAAPSASAPRTQPR